MYLSRSCVPTPNEGKYKSPSHSLKNFSSSPCCCFTELGTKHSEPKDDGRIGIKRCLIYRDSRCTVLCDQDLPGSDSMLWPKRLPPLGRAATEEQLRANRELTEPIEPGANWDWRINIMNRNVGTHRPRGFARRRRPEQHDERLCWVRNK